MNIKRMTIKFSLIQSLFWIIFCMLYAYANSYLSERGFSVSLIGAILAISSLFSIFLQPFFAKLVSKYKTITVKSILFYSFIAIFVFNLLFVFIDNNVLTILFTILTTILLSLQSFTYSLIFEYINRGYNINFGFTRGVGSISFALFSLAVGSMGAKFSFKYMPFVTCIFIIIFLCVLYSIESFNDVKEENIDHNSVIKLLKKYAFLPLFTIGFTLIFVSHSFLNSFLLNIVENVGGTNSNVGICLMIAAVVEFPMMSLFPIISKKIRNDVLIKFSAIMFLAKMLMVYLSINLPMLYFAHALQFFAYAIYVPSSTYFVNENMENKDRVTGVGLLISATIIGGIIGNLIGGELIQRYSVNIGMLFALISTFIGVIFILITKEKNVRK